jgi:hypothetical protein
MYLQIIWLHYLGASRPASERSGADKALRLPEQNQERLGVQLQQPL